MKTVKDGNVLQLNNILLFHGLSIFYVMSCFYVFWTSLKLLSNVRRQCLPCIFPCVQYVKFSLHDCTDIFFSTKFMIVNIFFPLKTCIKNCESNISFCSHCFHSNKIILAHVMHISFGMPKGHGLLNVTFTNLKCFCCSLVVVLPFIFIINYVSDALVLVFFFSHCLLYSLVCVLQLKSSLLLHIDGTSPVAEDIGRQVQ